MMIQGEILWWNNASKVGFDDGLLGAGANSNGYRLVNSVIWVIFFWGLKLRKSILKIGYDIKELVLQLGFRFFMARLHGRQTRPASQGDGDDINHWE